MTNMGNSAPVSLIKQDYLYAADEYLNKNTSFNPSKDADATEAIQEIKGQLIKLGAEKLAARNKLVRSSRGPNSRY